MNATRSHRGRTARRGFTIFDVISSAMIFPTILLTIALVGAREKARQAACMASLSAVGKGVVMYSALSSDQFPFPILYSKGDPNVKVDDKTASDKVFDKALGTAAMQNLWLMINENLASPDHFRCPSDRSWEKRDSTKKYGWTSPNQFSYGVHFPYDKDAAGNSSDAKLSDANGNMGIVILSDKNPGGSVGEKFAPSNHPGSGESVLYRDSHVSFYKNLQDSKCGYEGDDIYVNSAGVAGGVPTDPKGKNTGGDTSICLHPSTQPATQPASQPAK